MNLLLCAYGRAGYGVLEHALSRADISEIAVLTHEPRGATVDDVRELASSNGIWCSTEHVNTAKLPFAPDVAASVYYRYIVSAEFIDRCGGRIFNAHPSLLPRHRGCSSVPWAIIEGDHLTGVTFHYIDAGVDTGKILLQAALEIRESETQASLYTRCIDHVIRFWPAAFALVADGFPGVEQEGTSCFHPRGAPNGGVIEEDWPLDIVERFVRAMILPPLPPATFRGHEVRSLEEYLAIRDAAPA